MLLLTNVTVGHETDYDNRVYIAPQHVAAVLPRDEGTGILTTTGVMYVVAENLEQVVAKIKSCDSV